MKQLRIKHVIGYAQGEYAWFDDDTAANLVKSGAADYIVSESNNTGSVSESGSPKTRAASSPYKKDGSGTSPSTSSSSSTGSSSKKTSSKKSSNRNSLEEE